MNQSKDLDNALDERRILKQLLKKAQQDASHQKQPSIELTDEQSRQLALQIKKILKRHLN